MPSGGREVPFSEVGGTKGVEEALHGQEWLLVLVSPHEEEDEGATASMPQEEETGGGCK